MALGEVAGPLLRTLPATPLGRNLPLIFLQPTHQILFPLRLSLGLAVDRGLTHCQILGADLLSKADQARCVGSGWDGAGSAAGNEVRRVKQRGGRDTPRQEWEQGQG